MKSPFRLTALAVLFLGLVGYNFIRAYDESLWFPPDPGTPPANNVAVPINVGSVGQVKNGSLGVDGLSIFGTQSISASSPMIKFDDTDATGTIDFWTHVNNNTFYVLADRNNSGTWSAAPHPMKIVAGATNSSDYVQFSNKVRAKQYCNSDGTKCATMEDLINLIPYTCDVKFTYSVYGSTLVTRTETITGKDVNAKFAIGIYTSRSDSYPDALLGGTYRLTDEIGRDSRDCSTYDWDDTCHRSIAGYVDPLNYATNPSLYDASAVSNTGNNSWGYILASLPFKVNSSKTISNLGHDGFGANQVTFSAQVLSCTN